MATKPQQDDPVVENVRELLADRFGVPVDQVEIAYRVPLPGTGGLWAYLGVIAGDRRDWVTSRD